MGSRLQQLLRSLCFNHGWKYVVFWKLKHQAGMIFTWEDAYYDSNQNPDKKWFNETVGSLNDAPYSHDPLELAVAKMSYEVYSFGEGIVGWVAVSGKHSWIFSDKHVSGYSSTSEYVGGWQKQFSAGIKTIAVVAVIPHGVVQLGSLHKIAEDLKLVDHIRNVFCKLQDSLADCIPCSMESNSENSCLSDMCTGISDSAGLHDCIAKLDRSFHEDEMNLWSQLFLSLGKSGDHSHILPPPGGFSNKAFNIKMHERAERPMPGNEISLPSSSEIILKRPQRHEDMESLTDMKYGGEKNDSWGSRKRPEIMCMPSVKNVRSDECNSYNATLPTDCSPMVASNLPLEILDSPAFQDQGEFHVPERPSVQLHQDFEKNIERQIKSDLVEMQLSPISFPAGCELYEALRPCFQKQNGCVWKVEKTGSDMAIEISEGIGSSSLLMEKSDMHLLDAVVTKVSHKGDDSKSVKSCHVTGESILTTEETPCRSIGTISSARYSFNRDASSSLNSVTCGVESLKDFLSPSSSRENEHLRRPQEPVKMNKKRARPGESCRARLRDRQLVQDRIKELRELVPNGLKGSIGSLLERTMKHMFFMQSITNDAEKPHKCSASKIRDIAHSKLLDKDTGMQRFSCQEQGSSWAVEVGTDPKVCPIIVENINMNGQMRVEMLCEECTQILDIAETIRSLGLTILTRVSEAYGNKTWICFVVEGQNNRSMNRMDVLWSLMQHLQPKITN